MQWCLRCNTLREDHEKYCPTCVAKLEEGRRILLDSIRTATELIPPDCLVIRILRQINIDIISLKTGRPWRYIL